MAILPPEAGELVVNALNAIVDKRVDDQPGHEGVREYTGTAIPTDCMAQRRADALARMAEHYLATGQDGTRSLAGSERCQVMLHVDLETLQRNGREANGRLGQDTWLHPDNARRLSCDASLVTVLKDNQGNVLNIGRRSRIVPPHIQRALDVRDQGQCRYPGCQCRQYTDAHHVTHWADGGETSLNNLVTLCRYHHRALHRGEFSVDHNHVLRDRSGKRLPTVFTPAYAGLTVQKLTKDDSYETCRTQWSGEAMDYDIAVGALLAMEEMEGMEESATDTA